MSRNVIPLRPPAAKPKRRTGPQPRVIPRAITTEPGMSKEAVREACLVVAGLIDKYEGRMNALAAKVMHDNLPPIETWVGAILSTPEDNEPDTVVLVPRDQAIEASAPSAVIVRTLKEKPLDDRLDVVVHCADIGMLVSLEIEPAFPVTRKQAEAANVPLHLLFARGEAFATVGEQPAETDALENAWKEHRRLLEERHDEILEDLRTATVQHEIGDCAGVLLSLGEDGQAAAVVTREKARRLLVNYPFLARRLAGRGPIRKKKNGRETAGVLHVVIWAKGHVSVQSLRVRAVGP